LAILPKSNLPGDPILSAWISTDGHYAFVEFRSSEEANNGFLLNNITILGQVYLNNSNLIAIKSWKT